MRFVFFTDIHLLENKDSIIGFEKCLDRMLAFEPQLLINGGDLGVTPEAVKTYHQMIQELPIRLVLDSPSYLEDRLINSSHPLATGAPREGTWQSALAQVMVESEFLLIKTVSLSAS